VDLVRTLRCSGLFNNESPSDYGGPPACTCRSMLVSRWPLRPPQWR